MMQLRVPSSYEHSRKDILPGTSLPIHTIHTGMLDGKSNDYVSMMT